MATIKRLVKFATSDGKEWLDEGSAKEHEVNLETSEQLRTILAASIKTGRVEAVIQELLVEQTAIRKVLVRFNSRQPKSQELAKAA